MDKELLTNAQCDAFLTSAQCDALQSNYPGLKTHDGGSGMRPWVAVRNRWDSENDLATGRTRPEALTKWWCKYDPDWKPPTIKPILIEIRGAERASVKIIKSNTILIEGNATMTFKIKIARH